MSLKLFTPQPLALRDYQQALIQGILEAWKQDKRLLAQLPTGGGKTIIFTAIAREFYQRGEPVLVLAHRQELVQQAVAKIQAVTGITPGVIKAGIKPDYDCPIQVASVQSLVNRLSYFEQFGLIITDEAHHATAKTYRKIYEAFSDSYHLGVTATPIRLDGTGFKDCYDNLICGATVGELIKSGYLSRFKLYAAPSPMTTKGVRTRQGDYSTSGLAEANDAVELAGNLIDSYREYASGKRCLVFAVNVEHATTIAQRYNEAGIPAIALNGKTPDEVRQEALAKFAAGEIKIIANCQLFTEGLDVPALEAVQVARPTKSLALHLQTLGRALRPAEGKSHAIFIDHTNNWDIHGLPTRRRVWTLDGVEPVEQKKKIKRRPDGLITEELEIVETDQHLTEVSEPTEAELWQIWWRDLLETQRSRGYQQGWLYHRLVEQNPPLAVWQEFAKLKGYKRGWAYHRWREQQQEQQRAS